MIFDYGTVIIGGSGGRKVVMHTIVDPFHLQTQCDYINPLSNLTLPTMPRPL
jgi:hypothetical protein